MNICWESGKKKRVKNPCVKEQQWTKDGSRPAIARFEEDLMWFSVDDFTWQTEWIARLQLTTSAVGINTQLVEQFHGIWQTVTYLQHFTAISRTRWFVPLMIFIRSQRRAFKTVQKKLIQKYNNVQNSVTLPVTLIRAAFNNCTECKNDPFLTWEKYVSKCR